MAVGHVGGAPRFVNEHKSFRIQIALAIEPRLPLLQEIGTALLARVTSLLLTLDPMTLEEPPKGADRNADVPPREFRACLAKRHFAMLFKQTEGDTGMLVKSCRTLASTRFSGNRPDMLACRLSPTDRTRNAHSKPRRCSATTQTVINRRDNPITQILR